MLIPRIAWLKKAQALRGTSPHTGSVRCHLLLHLLLLPLTGRLPITNNGFLRLLLLHFLLQYASARKYIEAGNNKQTNSQ